MYLRSEFDNEDLTAMREFLHYFIKKRNELVKKLEKLTLVERTGLKAQHVQARAFEGGFTNSNSNLVSMEQQQ